MNSSLLSRHNSRAFLAALMLALLGARGVAQTWGTYQGNIAHTGFIPISVNTAGFSQIWQTQFANALPLNQPAAGDGRVFVTERNYMAMADLIAVDAETGDKLWWRTYPSVFSVNPPAYSQGKVYVQTCDNTPGTYLNCYDTAGGLVYSVPHTAQFEHYLAPTIDNGVVYIDGGSGGGMYAFDSNNGTEFWFNQRLPQYDQWTPTLDADEAYTYLGYLDGVNAGLYAVNRRSGLTDFTIPDSQYSWYGYDMGEAPALSGNTAYVTQNGRLIAFDLAARQIAWQTHESCAGQPDAVGDVVYVIDAGALTAFNASNGFFQWAWRPPTGSLSGTIIVTNNVAIVGSPTMTYAIDLATQTQLWSANVGGEMAIADGKLYVADSTGTLTAFKIMPQLSGTVLLEDLAGSAAGRQVTIQVRSPGSTTALDTYTATLDASGFFTVDTTRSGTFDVAIKASHWLRRVIKGVTFGSSGASGVNATLINGDVNGDNVVSLADFAQLRAAFGSSPGYPTWNPQADLNGDGFVGLADFGILRKHFGQSGDN